VVVRKGRKTARRGGKGGVSRWRTREKGLTRLNICNWEERARGRGKDIARKTKKRYPHDWGLSCNGEDPLKRFFLELGQGMEGRDQSDAGSSGHKFKMKGTTREKEILGG